LVLLNLTFARLTFSKKERMHILVGIPSINALDYAFVAFMYAFVAFMYALILS